MSNAGGGLPGVRYVNGRTDVVAVKIGVQSYAIRRHGILLGHVYREQSKWHAGFKSGHVETWPTRRECIESLIRGR